MGSISELIQNGQRVQDMLATQQKKLDKLQKEKERTDEERNEKMTRTFKDKYEKSIKELISDIDESLLFLNDEEINPYNMSDVLRQYPKKDNMTDKSYERLQKALNSIRLLGSFSINEKAEWRLIITEAENKRCCDTNVKKVIIDGYINDGYNFYPDKVSIDNIIYSNPYMNLAQIGENLDKIQKEIHYQLVSMVNDRTVEKNKVLADINQEIRNLEIEKNSNDKREYITNLFSQNKITEIFKPNLTLDTIEGDGKIDISYNGILDDYADVKFPSKKGEDKAEFYIPISTQNSAVLTKEAYELIKLIEDRYPNKPDDKTTGLYYYTGGYTNDGKYTGNGFDKLIWVEKEKINDETVKNIYDVVPVISLENNTSIEFAKHLANVETCIEAERDNIYNDSLNDLRNDPYERY